jgi:hypothetical protein
MTDETEVYEIKLKQNACKECLHTHFYTNYFITLPGSKTWGRP